MDEYTDHGGAADDTGADAPVPITMPDGSVIWARVSGRRGSPVEETDVAFGLKAAGRKVEHFTETIQSVAASVQRSLVGLKPSVVSVEFGLDLSYDTNGVVRVVLDAGAKVSLKVRLDWDLQSAAPGTEPAATTTA
jgi:hypothetical protein